MVITSRPPPLTISTLSRPSVRTSRNSISARTTEPISTVKARNYHLAVHLHITLYSQLDSLSIFVSLGGPGKFKITNWASWDLFTITSFSFTAVCIRLTLPSSLQSTYILVSEGALGAVGS